MTASTLRRKLVRKSAVPPPQDAPVAQPPQDRALAQVLGQGLGLSLSDVRSRQFQAACAEVLDLVDPDGLALLLRLADGGAGVLSLDRAGALALAEVATLGTPAPRAPTLRAPTALDCALIEPFLLQFVILASEVGGDVSGAIAEDHRLLGVALEEVEYDLYRIEATMTRAGRARALALVLALPQPVPVISAATTAGGDPAPEGWGDQLQQAVLGAPADLRAVLSVVHKPLCEVMEMGVGTRIELPLSLLEEVRLESLDRQLCATGRLGQSRGMRAIRLTSLPAGPATLPVIQEDEGP